MNLLTQIINHIFGRKYYANIIFTRGTDRCDICSFIFRSKEEARKHMVELQSNLSYEYLETISFRSYQNY